MNILELADGVDWTRAELNGSHLGKFDCGRFQFDFQHPGDYSSLRVLMVDTEVFCGEAEAFVQPSVPSIPGVPDLGTNVPDVDMTPIPEPSSLLLLGAGLLALARKAVRL